MTRRGGAAAPVVWAPRCWAKKPLFPRLALRLAGLPNCSPGKRSSTGDACDIEALQRFQHPHFTVNVAGATQRPVNVLKAEMFI